MAVLSITQGWNSTSVVDDQIASDKSIARASGTVHYQRLQPLDHKTLSAPLRHNFNTDTRH
jgi:hypothetical protein